MTVVLLFHRDETIRFKTRGKVLMNITSLCVSFGACKACEAKFFVSAAPFVKNLVFWVTAISILGQFFFDEFPLYYLAEIDEF